MIREQAKLELGENYEDAARAAARMVETILNKTWFHPTRVKTNEGGQQAMVDHLLAHIVAEGGSIRDGITNYMAYLAAEYTSHKAHNRVAKQNKYIAHSPVHTMGEWVHYTNPASSLIADYNDERERSGSEVSDRTEKSSIETKNVVPRQLAQAGSLVASAEPAGISQERLRKMDFKAKQWAEVYANVKSRKIACEILDISDFEARAIQGRIRHRANLGRDPFAWHKR